MDFLSEKSRTFCGSAKVSISQLCHEDLLTNPRQLDPKNVARLKNIYLLEGCHRLDSEHHVPALINEASLDRALRAATISRSALKGLEAPEQLVLEGELTVLHGRHRLEAAKDFLSADDKWWVVDLYLEDLNESSKDAIREEYSNALTFSDGDIFRHLRHCVLQGLPSGTWLARLSESKRRDLKQLEKLAEEDEEMKRLRDSIDRLLPYTGLWPALKIGTFHRLLPLRCPEELTHYLSKVEATWAYILGNDQDLRRLLDSHTVQTLEGRCPHYSREDLHFVESKLSGREIFVSPSFDSQRDQILGRIREIRHVIPSIHTFLEDTKYLEPCAKIMKGILGAKFKGSVRQAFERQHNGQKVYPEQIDEAGSEEHSLESGTAARWKSYRQLWLFAFRHFPQMTGETPRKDPRRPKPKPVNIEYSWWHAMCVLAVKSGYTAIRNTFVGADEAMARDFLRHARPPQLYRFDDSAFDLSVRQICDTLKQARPSSDPIEGPSISSDRDSCGTDLSFRCGKPFEQAFLEDSSYLYMRYIYRNAENVQRKEHLTSFAVKRDTFHCFFGVLAHDVVQHRITISTSPQRSEIPETREASQSLVVYAAGPANASIPATHAPEEPVVDGITSPVTETTIVRGPRKCSWDDLHRLCEHPPPSTLILVAPLEPFDDDQVEYEYLPFSEEPGGKIHLQSALKIAGAMIEHSYMDYDDVTGCKSVYALEIAENPGKFGAVIVRTPNAHFDKMKGLWEKFQAKT